MHVQSTACAPGLFRSLAAILAIWLASIALCGASQAAGPNTWLVTTNTTLADGDLSFEGFEVIVRGATLTINGAHEFASLTIERSLSNQPGVVTHGAGFSNGSVNGASLVVAGDLFVQGPDRALVGSALIVSGRGFAGASGPGAGSSSSTAAGAGHGGIGGPSSGDAPGGGTYGSPSAPVDFGSGGGNDTGIGGTTGGAGGGVLRLVVQGVLAVDGVVAADGATGASSQAGGGAGGSIWIECATLAGAGTISANGGPGAGSSLSHGGGGAGGRVAIATSSLLMPDSSIVAHGSRAVAAVDALHAGAGTIWLDVAAAPRPVLIVDNGTNVGERTTFSGSTAFDADLLVRRGGRLGPAVGDSTLHLSFGGDATVASDGEITATGAGFDGGSGPGVGASDSTAGGGGHGGIGGPPSGSSLGGGTYGTPSAPTEFGSGGGNDTQIGGTSGGRGGGALRLTVAGALTVEGSIAVDGAPGVTQQAGGGAGGSLWIDCATLAGAGTVTANGGVGAGSVFSYGGGGAGGRIRVDVGSLLLSESSIQAHGAQSQEALESGHAGAGTIWLNLSSAPRPRMIVDNGNNLGERTAFTGENSFDADLLVRRAGRVGPAVGDATLHLSFDGDVAIEPGSEITATGTGLAGGSGPGAGTSDSTAGGGGHGGLGARTSGGALGGSVHGSPSEPVDLGSGGGNDTGVGGTSGGRGGGALRLTVAGILTVDGSIEADGAAGITQQAGGGAGGSLWIDCAELAGAGTVSANGGAGAGSNTSHGGGGAGGRIRIDAESILLPEANMVAHGGQSGMSPLVQHGGAGTLWFQVAAAPRPLMVVDNGGNPGERTAFSGASAFDADLVVRRAGRVGPPVGDATLHLSLSGDVAIASDGEITATGGGLAGASGPGAGTTDSTAGGGGHGGLGAAASGGAAGGATYGSPSDPFELGSGGGNDTGLGGTTGGRGGGAIRLTVAGVLTVDGSIEADGAAGTTGEAGGGAGGTLRIECAVLAGTGSVSASGGAGAGSISSHGGGGSGGRILIHAGSLALPDTSIVAHGGQSGASAAARHGAAGTIWLERPSEPRPIMIVDNGSNPGERTAFSGVNFFDADLILRRAARVGPAVGDGSMHLIFAGDAAVSGDSEITASAGGFPGASGPAPGGTASTAGGGGHGGSGGSSSGGELGGGTYGSPLAPIEFGSGGGNDTGSGGTSGGRGGGALRVSVAGVILLDGSIVADGGAGTIAQAGGGAGGSVWVTAGGIFGSGAIAADGGAGSGSGSSYGGGGGGGRVAIYCCAVEIPAKNITVDGGQGGTSANFGDPGSIGIFSNTVDFLVPPMSSTVEGGATAQFTVVATGEGPLGYQWYFEGVALQDRSGISGAQSDTLQVQDVQCGVNTGAYRVAVLDGCGVAFSQDAILLSPVAGDFNDDCEVDGADLGTLLGAWGPCPGCPADLNGDGVVDGADLGLLLGAWS